MAASTNDQVSEDGHLRPAPDAHDSPNELVKAVDELLDNLSVRFSKVSTEVFAKMDEMAQRLDELEASIKAGADSGDGN
ncbi:MAG: hypothetical protein LQ351_003191 [Letrouitia transgressa]|nr:MAG: hypothetical protein LQ351_003191 [Letrouitia transgressa]